MKKIFISMLYSTLLLLGVVSINADDKISAYLVGEHIEVDVAKAKLGEVGFEVIALYSPVKEGTTLIFTNEVLKAEGAKSKRAHAAILRMFIDDKEKRVSVTNPIYFGRAFMQDWYKEDVFIEQFEKIYSAFPNLEGSKDSLEFDNLADFHFMMGMPYYEDPDELAEGEHKDLLAKARNYKKGKLLIFELKLSDKSTLFGYEIGSKTKKFVKKIGRANAAVLPYCISIEDGKATALAPKFYLAVSYPQLSLSEFTRISSVPGAIEKDLKKPFK
ncbi:hypothetical protein [Sulfurimonas sp.]|uniref:hypothetical protein n=1 Tax=Sulfurimonas sp. TaxID=2022749 RepID=UPI0035657ADA